MLFSFTMIFFITTFLDLKKIATKIILKEIMSNGNFIFHLMMNFKDEKFSLLNFDHNQYFYQLFYIE